MEGFSHGKTAFLAAIDQGGIRSFGFVQLAAKNLKSSKIPALFLKIDIARAFDTVLTHMSFGACWREWISLIFADSSWKILLDGRPGERIFHARGLRQGDLSLPCCLCWSWKCSIVSSSKPANLSSCLHCVVVAWWAG